MTQETEQDDETQYETEDVETRWKGLSTTIALSITAVYLAIPVLSAFGIANLDAITQSWFLALTMGFIAVLVYTFGHEAIATAKDALGK